MHASEELWPNFLKAVSSRDEEALADLFRQNPGRVWGRFTDRYLDSLPEDNPSANSEPRREARRWIMDVWHSTPGR